MRGRLPGSSRLGFEGSSQKICPRVLRTKPRPSRIGDVRNQPREQEPPAQRLRHAHEEQPRGLHVPEEEHDLVETEYAREHEQREQPAAQGDGDQIIAIDGGEDGGVAVATHIPPIASSVCVGVRPRSRRMW